ncbi:MAG: carbohydrate-binding family 9-like protein [Chitinophagaceae bacterium]
MLYIQEILPQQSTIEDIQEVKKSLIQYTDVLDIDMVNWKNEFPDSPKVQLHIGYNDYFIFLYYKVAEKYTLAKVDHNNGEVWTDSCTEFFISWAKNASYYNFETNCIGKCILGFTDIEGNKYKADNYILEKIKIQSSLGNKVFPERKDTQWDITIAIPLECFYKHEKLIIKNQTARANFYKCGDHLSLLHFLSWTKIDTPHPSFHQPQFFGEICFKK